MSIYRLVNFFDVWGNAKDGWEVNDQHVITENLEIPENATEKEIVTYLNKMGFFIINDMRRFAFEYTGNGMEIYQKKGMKPLCALEIIDSK